MFFPCLVMMSPETEVIIVLGCINLSFIFTSLSIHITIASCILLWLWHIWQNILQKRCFSFPLESDADVTMLSKEILLLDSSCSQKGVINMVFALSCSPMLL